MLVSYFNRITTLPAHSANRLRHHRWWRIGIILTVVTLMLGVAGTSTASANPSAVSWPAFRLQLVAEGFEKPVEVTNANDGSNRIFVLERGGLIHIVQDGQRIATPFLDISDRVTTACGECGLLGIAFPPNFAEEGYFFVSYISNEDLAAPDTEDPNTERDSVISRFRLTSDPNVADAGSEERILTINQPAANHNGGHILFGPDGYLYIGMGDGGEGGDAFENAQNSESLHGKILRIAVDATGTYTIPDDNPFVDDDDYRSEIWAWGLRNPWRFGFDDATGDLYIADVGQGDYEEINYIAAADLGNGGQNYGWSEMEGTACYPPGGSDDCDRDGLILPVVTYDHSQGDCSITGGFVWTPSPDQAPLYLYGDFCSGRIWGMQKDGAGWATYEFMQADFRISSFGEDEAGNAYVADYDGAVYQLAPFESASYMPTVFKAEQIPAE